MLPKFWLGSLKHIDYSLGRTRNTLDDNIKVDLTEIDFVEWSRQF